MNRLQTFLKSYLVSCAVFVGFAHAADAGNVRTVMFTGDSIACGVGASSMKTTRFSTVAVKMLNEAAGKTAYREVNIAISGSTMTDQPWPGGRSSGYPYRLQDVLKNKPDILVIQHGVNDNGVGCSLHEFSLAYRSFVREVKAKLPGTLIVCMTLCPTPYYNTPAHKRWWSDANAAIQEIAACENTLLVQVNLAIDNRFSLFPDKIHPNDEGHRIIAGALVKTILEERKMSKKDFDLVVNYPGVYRVCGFSFDVQKLKENEFAVFKHIGTGKWQYKIASPAKITTPFLYCYSKHSAVADNGREIVFQWQKYQKSASLLLPATDGKMVNVTITPEK